MGKQRAASRRIWRDPGRRGLRPRRGPATTLLVIVAAVALIAAACGKSTSKSSSGATPTAGSSIAPPVGTKIQGGTVTWAEAPQVSPNYIFPVDNGQVFSVANLDYFQYLLYRPLYWFGNNYKASADDDYSIAKAPVWSNNNTTVTISLKPWKWSDGETVTSRDVLFFLNILKAKPSNYAAYVPGYFPDNVKSYSAPDASTVVLNLTQAYSPDWFLYNELSQLTPLPLAWDVTAAGQTPPTADNGHLPDSTPAGALAVYTYLDSLAKNTAGYAASPVWSIVDGPWKLANYTNTGELDFVPNTSYSGSPKPTIAHFNELPFTSEDAEINETKTGASNLTIGYIPQASVPQEPSILAKGYDAYTLFSFSTNYFVPNLHNPTMGPVFSQLYFRQAFQELINQQGWISAFTHGSSIPQYGVIPANPPNTFIDAKNQTFPWNFSISGATKLLTDHGWKVVPGGQTTCTSPGTGSSQCGAGITQGQAISFNLDYQAGPVALDEEMKDLKSEAAKVGITINLTTHPFNQVIGAAVPCMPTEPKCAWQVENWGGGWVYSPDYYPSGEEIWATGAVANYGSYSDPQADALIAATTTETASPQTALNAYQDYMQQQLPVWFQPNAAGNPVPGGLTIVSNHLGGFSANAFSAITPETYYLTQ